MSIENKNINEKFLEEDEIDLRELFNTIWVNKFKIAIFTFVITFLTILYTLSIPNSYKSEVILSPQGEQSTPSLGGLSSLASLVGVSLGGLSNKDPLTMMQTVLNDYEFNKYVIEKYNIVEKLNNPQNLVFALGFDKLYSKKENDDTLSKEEIIFNANKLIKEIISISSDKKSDLITLSAEFVDRFAAKELVDIYLFEIINKIKVFDMKEIEKQITYYNKELASTYDVTLKEQLSKSISGLMQKRVFSQANDYYIVSKLVDSRVAYVKEKSKPKRALIVVVSFVTSVILGIFLVFLLEFIRGNKENENSK